MTAFAFTARAAIALAFLPLAGCRTATPVAQTSTPAAPAVVPRLPNDIKWSRASAEHRALFIQTYRLAERQLDHAVSVLASGGGSTPWAVIMDADETVLDNWQYQYERALLDSGFTSASWNAWVRRMAAPALPGAVEFTQQVHRLGGRVAIVTNRDEATCPETRENLRTVSIVADVVLCQTGPGDKNPRFEAVEKGTASAALPPLKVLMYVGDNIQDFPRLKQDVRLAPDSALASFGTSFILLPNPMYGSWERNPVR